MKRIQRIEKKEKMENGTTVRKGKTQKKKKGDRKRGKKIAKLVWFWTLVCWGQEFCWSPKKRTNTWRKKRKKRERNEKWKDGERRLKKDEMRWETTWVGLAPCQCQCHEDTNKQTTNQHKQLLPTPFHIQKSDLTLQHHSLQSVLFLQSNYTEASLSPIMSVLRKVQDNHIHKAGLLPSPCTYFDPLFVVGAVVPPRCQTSRHQARAPEPKQRTTSLPRVHLWLKDFLNFSPLGAARKKLPVKYYRHWSQITFVQMPNALNDDLRTRLFPRRFSL